MGLKKLIIASTLLFAAANANDVMMKSMSQMENGMIEIQKGFLNNNIELINKGLKSVKEGNALFSDEKVIAQYLPENKKHLVNVAKNAAERITLSSSVLELNLEEKAYINATNAYSDMLNACSRCHALVRNW
ncbi:hypothetical protein GCM10012288_02320 [Malaciobacter pacificus]|jgi:predicted CopG family antitoxin|uniref:Uncharacterized protein n=1 Tax=Malaciobacter pacificus TaxID=1080223 RepID=A0A5C2H4Z9_9BACT|nr:hypothetical protein [Malaciobacter pacificus]QEP33489.1 hypothetical protein APAC_0327 [Malaciobacter pacificus]GGD31936.1 hypothetical protein GCM10012288_02320 [Malaciobacter pacificus]